jgi:hypothetical protein
MVTTKRPFGHHALSAMVFVLVLGTLSMIWPGIIALILGIFLLLQSCGGGQEVVILSWATIDEVSIAFASLRRPDSPAVLA